MSSFSGVKRYYRRQKQRLGEALGRVTPDSKARRKNRLTLRLCYWHQHPEGEQFVHRRDLAKFFQGYLDALNQQRPGFDWTCRPVSLGHRSNRSIQTVAVEVEFIHNSIAHHDNINGAQQARQLWAQLANLPQTEDFQSIFGSTMISMNIFAVRVTDATQKEYARTIIVQDLSVEKKTTVRLISDPWESMVDDAILLSPVVISLIKFAITARATMTNATPTEIQTAAQASLELSSCIKQFWEVHKKNKKESNEAAMEISKSLASASTLFHEAYVRGHSRLGRIFNTDNPTCENVWSALMAFRTMHLLYPRFKEALDILKELRNHKRRKNMLFGSGISLIATALVIFAGTCLVGPGALIGASAWAAGAGGIASAGIGVGAGYVTLDNFFEGAVLEKMEQLGSTFHETSMAVTYYLAVCWVERICYISFESAPAGSMETLLKRLGVDRACWKEPGYRTAWLESSASKLTNDYNELTTLVKGLFSKMDVKIGTTYQEPRRAV